MARPLKLKVQEVAPKPGPAAQVLPVAKVWVDSGIPTLTEPFSYLIPERLSEQITIGSRVQVPFKDRHLEGLVIERTSRSANFGDLKSIEKLLGEFPVADPLTIKLIVDTTKSWGGNPYDVIRSAIPVRVATVEKSFARSTLDSVQVIRDRPTFHLLPPKCEPITALLQLVKANSTPGSKLIIVPTARELRHLANLLSQNGILFGTLDSDVSRAERYRNFLAVSLGHFDLVIGMRSAIFAPIPNLSAIYLHQENSEHYYERRAPYWNTREVLSLRSENSDFAVHLTGYTPSIAVAIEINHKNIAYRAVRSRNQVIAQVGINSELIPSKIFQLVRKSLLTGPVLFLVPSKGYATAISCAKCRNFAQCDCGGKLSKSTARGEPSCLICNRAFPDWRCDWCGESRIYLSGRGIERFAEEIGRAFPRQRVIQSTSANQIADVSADPALIISTPGVEPLPPTGYSAVVILQVDRFLNVGASNGTERAYSQFFAASALASSDGVIGIVHEDGSPIVSALASWNPATISKREIEERIQLRLPPVSSAAILIAETSELMRIKRALETARDNGKAPTSLRIYGPSSQLSGESKITLLFEPEVKVKVIALLEEINRRRMITKKPLISYRISPYSLN